MKKVLFYCQNLLGIGHLTRSLAICRSLLEDFEVHFVQGGPDVGKTIEHPRFVVHRLSPLLMRETDSSLYDPSEKRTVEEIFADRAKALTAIAETEFDHCIIELYPFGRRKFRHEVLELLTRLRRTNAAIQVHSSLRDILVESQGTVKRMEEAIEIIEKNFDSVLVHSDPAFFRLEDTFSLAPRIQDKLIYTGFVTERTGPAPPRSSPSREKRILVSLGGGSVGGELMEAILPVVPLFPEYTFTFVPGPFTSAPLTRKFEEARSALKNLEVIAFLRDFESVLSRSALSISLAGYNTVMNLLNTRTRGLVYPYLANQEQTMRAERLMKEGLLALIGPKELSSGAENLARLVRAELAKDYPDVSIALDGANETRRILTEGAMK